MQNLLMFSIVVLIPCTMQAETLADAKLLNDNLSSGHDRNLRPINNQDDILFDDIAVFPIALQEFD